MIDTHAHLTDKVYPDYNLIIKNAKESGVNKIITVGYDENSSFFSKKIAEENEDVFFTAGIHPSECKKVDNGVIDRLLPLFSHEKCLAVGEIGLDYHYGKDSKEEQKQLFKRQLDLAVDVSLPVIIHSREATQDMLEVLSLYSAKLKKGFLMHCYSESAESAKEYLKLGAYFAFGGAITFKNAKKEDIIRSIPIEKLLCETDCPYMSPVPFRGQANEPKRVTEVYKKMADVLDISNEDLKKITAKNAVDFFGEKRLGKR